MPINFTLEDVLTASETDSDYETAIDVRHSAVETTLWTGSVEGLQMTVRLTAIRTSYSYHDEDFESGGHSRHLTRDLDRGCECESYLTASISDGSDCTRWFSRDLLARLMAMRPGDSQPFFAGTGCLVVLAKLRFRQALNAITERHGLGPTDNQLEY